MPGDPLTCVPWTDRLRHPTPAPKRRVRRRPLGPGGGERAGWGVSAGRAGSAFLDSLSRGRAGVGAERRPAGGGGGGGGGSSRPVLPLRRLALQQPDFPEMMGRCWPIGVRAAPRGRGRAWAGGIPLSV